jgi:sporulation protein YlmC with PRC-barrel domain
VGVINRPFKLPETVWAVAAATVLVFGLWLAFDRIGIGSEISWSKPERRGGLRTYWYSQPMEASMRVILGTLLAFALISPVAMAQVPANTPSAAAAPIAAGGQWRASKVIGVNVYNEQNQKLGDISELIIDSSGRVDGAVIGVGGFLGMGEHNIMVPLNKLKFSNEAGKTTTGTKNSDTKEWYPDRAVLNADKDQLKAMPEFKY